MALGAFCLVRMADGTDKPVGDIVPGDSVFDPESGLSFPVRDVFGMPGVGMTAVTTANGRILHLTGDHAVFTADSGTPIPAEKIAPGTPLQTAEGASPCAAVEAIPGDFKVYGIVAGGLTRILAGGIVVEP